MTVQAGLHPQNRSMMEPLWNLAQLCNSKWPTTAAYSLDPSNKAVKYGRMGGHGMSVQRKLIPVGSTRQRRATVRKQQCSY